VARGEKVPLTSSTFELILEIRDVIHQVSVAELARRAITEKVKALDVAGVEDGNEMVQRLGEVKEIVFSVVAAVVVRVEGHIPGRRSTAPDHEHEDARLELRELLRLHLPVTLVHEVRSEVHVHDAVFRTHTVHQSFPILGLPPRSEVVMGVFLEF
jgi:hypothetical protein